MTDAREADRLTDQDRAAILARIDETISGWIGYRDPPRVILPDSITALERIAAHAIGCSAADLRTVELEWITAECRLAIDRGRGIAGACPVWAT